MRDTGLRFVNFLLHFVVVLCLALACRAQGASNIPNTISIQASGAPSGACGNNFVYTNSATNDFYNCVAGAWNKVTAAGASVSITATAPVVMTPSPTTGTGVASCPTCLTGTNPTNHGVLLGAGTQAPSVTAAGTTGQVLTGVTGSDPTFQAVTLPTGVGGPGMILLEEHTASASTEIDFTSCISSTYDTYRIVGVNLTVSTAMLVGFQMSTNGGSTYDTGTNYSYEFGFASGSSGGAVSQTSQTAMNFRESSTTVAANNSYNFDLTMYNPGGAIHKYTSGLVAFDNNGQLQIHFWTGKYLSTTAVNAFRVIPSTGNFPAGTVRCYGVTK